MKIFSNDNLRNIDQATIQEGVSAMELIHRVAEGVVKEITRRFNTHKPIVVFAGSGNNGADALIVSKLLIEAGYSPEIYLFNIKGNSLSRDCREAYNSLMTLPYVRMTEIIDTARIPELSPDHLVIDGLFGTGLRSSLEGGFKMLARYITDSGATVYSIDIPSGLFSDWNQGNLSRDIVHATITFAVQYPRLSFMLSDNADIVGEWRLLDIGLSRAAADATPTKYYYVEKSDVAGLLKPRKPFCSKADFGTALIYSGCYGMMGAAVMAARGALRAGVGKLTVHSGRCGFDVIQSQVPEALFEPDPKDILISDMTPRHSFNAICAGPGIGINDATRGALKTLVMNVRNPLVLDADALNILAREPALFNHIAAGTILTPHAGEFDRIFGSHSSAEARLLRAVEVTHKFNIVIVLKGKNTAIVLPDGRIFFNSSGCTAMSTPGCGDVLAGVITALLAQGYKPETAAVAGVFIHGLAGEMAAEIHGSYGTTALDIADNVGRAIASILNSKK